MAPNPTGAPGMDPDAPLTEVLGAHPLFAGLEPAILERLAENAWRQKLAAGDPLFHEGDTATHYLLVLRGQMEMVRFSQEGDEHVFQSFGPGSLVAEAAMFMQHGRYPMSSRAGSEGITVWRLSGASLRSACESHGVLATRLLCRLSQRLYHRVNEVEWLTSSTAQQRLAAYFVSLATLRRLCGGMRVAMPTAMPSEPLTNRLGKRAGRMVGSWFFPS